MLLLAAGLRFWNVEHDSDLSVVFSQDARNYFYQAKDLATKGDIPTAPNQRYLLYRQPLFIIRSYAAIWSALDRVGLAGDDRRMRIGYTIYIILFSLGTVVLVFQLGNIVLGGPNPALFASLLFATFPVSVVGCLYVKEDTALMFWFTAALLAMAKLIQTGRKRWYLWSGFLLGMAISTKYPGLLLLPIFLLAHVFRVLQARTGDRIKTLLVWQCFAALGVTVLTFLSLNSQAVTEWSDALKGFLYQIEYAGAGHHDGTIIWGSDYWWTFYLRYAILPGITWPATLLCLAGLVLAVVQRNRLLILIAFTVLLIYIQFESSPAKPFPFFARYLDMLYPLLAILAAFAFFALWRRLQARVVQSVLGVMIGLICILVPFGTSMLVVTGARPDTRTVATRWIEGHLPTGSRIILGSRMYSPQQIDSTRFQVKYDRQLQMRSAAWLQKQKFDYLVVSSFQYDRYSFSLKSSKTSRKIYRNYESFAKNLELVQVIQPRFGFQSYGEHNPVIRIYRIS